MLFIYTVILNLTTVARWLDTKTVCMYAGGGSRHKGLSTGLLCGRSQVVATLIRLALCLLSTDPTADVYLAWIWTKEPVTMPQIATAQNDISLTKCRKHSLSSIGPNFPFS